LHFLQERERARSEARRKNGAPKSCPFRDAKNTQKDLSQSPKRGGKKDRVETTKPPPKKKETDFENKVKNRLAGQAWEKKSRKKAKRESHFSLSVWFFSMKNKTHFLHKQKNENANERVFFSPLAPSESEEVRAL
jgi:hypothetical protein